MKMRHIARLTLKEDCEDPKEDGYWVVWDYDAFGRAWPRDKQFRAGPFESARDAMQHAHMSLAP